MIMNSHRRAHPLTFSFLLLFLAGCSFPYPGKDPSTIEWDPVNLSSEGCPDISGSYAGRDALIPQFTVSGFLSIDRKYRITRHAPIPFKEIEVVRKPLPGQRILDSERTFTRRDNTEFYKTSQTVIRQTRDALTLQLRGADGQLYEEYEVPLTLPQIGCADGKIVIRLFNASYGTEGALGSAYAREARIRKLSDANLEVEGKSRTWYYSTRGLIGIGADGYASGYEPRRSGGLLIFQWSRAPRRPTAAEARRRPAAWAAPP